MKEIKLVEIRDELFDYLYGNRNASLWGDKDTARREWDEKFRNFDSIKKLKTNQ